MLCCVYELCIDRIYCVLIERRMCVVPCCLSSFYEICFDVSWTSVYLIFECSDSFPDILQLVSLLSRFVPLSASQNLQMDASYPPQASPLALPPGYLDAPSVASHPDSEEATQHERHPIAQELDTIRGRAAATSDAIISSTETTYIPDNQSQEQQCEGRWQLPHRSLPVQYNRFVKFWTTHVDITIDEGAHRDHLALERTFLGYLRTSLALAMAGVLTAQLFHLQRSVYPNPTMGFFVVGIPLSVTFIGFGMVVLLVGAYRFWLQQNAIVRGKIYAGGWDIVCLMVLSILICTAAFALVTTVDIMKTYF
ncbi:unnamed protein product [Periconia digitata]|uniref:DUF202 domain-containing protein n=1 Tax=Periconia digitata TaxID=1303443 RepID=A0A9W4U570_9PLEO|nr:unnamed protein product [Periconia digitata]